MHLECFFFSDLFLVIIPLVLSLITSYNIISELNSGFSNVLVWLTVIFRQKLKHIWTYCNLPSCTACSQWHLPHHSLYQLSFALQWLLRRSQTAITFPQVHLSPPKVLTHTISAGKHKLSQKLLWKTILSQIRNSYKITWLTWL